MTYRFHNPSPKALIFMFHGLFLSTSLSSYVGKRFYDEGYSVLGFDYEGHGKSEGQKGTISSLNDFLIDCENFIIKSSSFYQTNTLIFVAGIDIGGTLAIMTALKKPLLIKGILLFSPVVGPNLDHSPLVSKIIGCLNCCFSGIAFKTQNPELRSKNPFFPEFWAENPEIFSGKMTVRTAAALLNGIENLLLEAEELTTPVLLFQGGQDKILGSRSAKEFIKSIKTNDKELVFFEEMHHFVYEEPEIDEIIEKSIEWIDTRVYCLTL